MVSDSDPGGSLVATVTVPFASVIALTSDSLGMMALRAWRIWVVTLDATEEARR